MYIKAKTFDVKSYHKNRSQVVYKNLDNCKKSNYQIKGMKRSYYKKFYFFSLGDNKNEFV